MGDKSKIDWTDATWNPIVGCSIVSPACTNCYAMAQAGRIMRMALGHTAKTGEYGPGSHYIGLTEETKAGPVWTGKVAQAPDHILTAPLRWKRPRKIFVNSMGDLFHESVSDEWIDRVFAVMALAPQHTFQILTKRAARMREYFEARGGRSLLVYWSEAFAAGALPITKHEVVARLDPTRTQEHRDIYRAPMPIFPLPNVWLGVTAEDQARADERVPDLLATPAAKWFVSCEPLLGEIRFDRISVEDNSVVQGAHAPALALLDQIIAGGESGPRARPSHPDWFRSLRDQCAVSGTAYFFKQWGEWAPGEAFGMIEDGPITSATGDVKDWMNRYVVCADRADRLRGHSFTEHATNLVYRVGKRRAGHLLDGREHREFPA